MRLDRSKWILGLLAFQLAGGLVLVVCPDGIPQQTMLAAHTVAGPLALVTFVLYLRRHLARVLRSPRAIARLFGLTAMMLLGAALASGLFILGRSVLALHTADDWRFYHRVLGISGAIALVLHLVIVGRTAPGREALRGGAGVFTIGLALALAAGALAPRLDPGPGAGFVADVTKIPKEFAAAGSRSWNSNRSCGTTGCHEKALREWSASGHGLADSDPYYLTLEQRLVRDGKLDAVASCNECHDPVMLGDGRFARWVTEGAKGDVPHSGEAVGCLVCHAMTAAHGRRDRGNFTLGTPRRAPFQDTAVGAVLLRSFPAAHARAHSPPLYEKSQLCAACHRPDVAQHIEGFGLLRIENPHSRWALGKVRPKCQECHMPSADEDGPVSHRFPGSSQHLTADPDQKRLVADFLAGEITLPSVTGDLSRGPLLTLSAGPAHVTTDGGLNLEVALRHPGRIGHQFPAGAQDLVQVWIEGELKSGSRVLARWGEGEPGSDLLPGTPVFRRRGFHRYPEGVREVEHSWHRGGVPFPQLRPGDMHELLLPAPALPADLSEPPSLELTLRYRKISRAALVAMGAGALPLPPVTVLARGRWTVELRH